MGYPLLLPTLHQPYSWHLKGCQFSGEPQIHKKALVGTLQNCLWSILAIKNVSGGANKVLWPHCRYRTIGSISLRALKPSLGSQEKNSATLTPNKRLDLMSRTAGKYLSVATEDINPLTMLQSRTQEFWPVTHMAHCSGPGTDDWRTFRALWPVTHPTSFSFSTCSWQELAALSPKVLGLRTHCRIHSGFTIRYKSNCWRWQLLRVCNPLPGLRAPSQE